MIARVAARDSRPASPIRVLIRRAHHLEPRTVPLRCTRTVGTVLAPDAPRRWSDCTFPPCRRRPADGQPPATSPDRGFVKSRAHDHFSPGAEPRRTSPRLMVRLPSKLRGRFETTKNPVVRCGTLVLGRPGDDIFTYSAGRRLESESNPGKDQTGNRCTLVFAWLKTRNRQNECTTQCVHGRGPACVIAWKMVLRNTGV